MTRPAGGYSIYRMRTEDRSRIRSRAKSLTAAQRQLMDQLVDLRKKHRLSQPEVARRMGVHQSSVARIEAYDSNPTFSTLRRYALAIEARLRLEAYTDDGSDYAPSERSSAAGTDEAQSDLLVDPSAMGRNLPDGWKFESGFSGTHHIITWPAKATAEFTAAGVKK